jgi:hypothetical protein
MKSALVIFAMTLASVALAKPKAAQPTVYKAVNATDTQKQSCPLTITVPDKADVGLAMINSMFNVDDQDKEVKLVSSDRGSVEGVSGHPELSEDFLSQKYEVTIKSPVCLTTYPEGVRESIEVKLWEDDTYPEVVDYHQSLLNYQDSSELAATVVCDGLRYRRQ